MEDLEIEEVEFNEEMYKKNIEENEFLEKSTDERGDENANN